jgi:hypothetical protein
VSAETEPHTAKTLEDPLAEALRVVDVAARRGLVIRLLGGMAVRAHSPSWPARTRRKEVDIDFATRSKDRAAVYRLLEDEGYTPDKRHNALFGQKQGYFVDASRRRAVDVVVDRLEMCHVLDFGGRMELATPTLPVADLLLTKLQIVKINRKDVLDALALLAEHPLADDDGAPDAATGLAAINVRRITAITSADWGWWRTVTSNLETLARYLRTELQPDDLDLAPGRTPHYDPAAQVAALQAAIQAAGKSTGWKLRARVGDRVRWYNEPEELAHENPRG